MAGRSAKQSGGKGEEGPEKPATALDRWILGRFAAMLGNAPIAFELWDGTGATPKTSGVDLVARVEIRDRKTLHSLLTGGEVAFGDSLTAGRIRIRGDQVAFAEALIRWLEDTVPLGSWKRRLLMLSGGRRRYRPADSRSNVQHHYDIGNDFFRLWLDEEMQYTCGYFASEDATLDEAQRAKMDRICRKLQLRPGQHVLETGSGWGSLAIHMAREYGVRVCAYDLSEEMVRYANARKAQLDLGDQVEFVLDDYRNAEGKYDRFVAIEMLEHVGVKNYRGFGAMAARLLKPDGRGLLQFIGCNAPMPNSGWVERRIFPGAYLPSPREASAFFEPNGLSILDVENLRLHYARTCRAWLDRFETAADRVARMYGQDFVRAWRYYLAGSVAAYTTGSQQLYQVVFAPGRSNAVPLIRPHETE